MNNQFTALGREVVIVKDGEGKRYFTTDKQLIWNSNEVEVKDLQAALYLHGSYDKEVVK